MFMALADMMQFSHGHADAGTATTDSHAKLAAFRTQYSANSGERQFQHYLTTHWIANGKMGE